MNSDRATVAAAIGERVRRERKSREWTLDNLASATGISRRQLVTVEQGEANPSIGTLLALCDALGISLVDLLDSPSFGSVTVRRAGEGAELWTGPKGGRGVLLIGTHTPDTVNVWDWRMNPGERHESTAHRRGCREVLHVLSGTASLVVAGDRYDLSVGDSITFPGDVAHAYSNSSAAPVHFSLTVYQPQLGSARIA